MSELERSQWAFAHLLEQAIAKAFRDADDVDAWVADESEALVIMSRMRGVFVASLVGEVEGRIGRGFGSTLDQLPDGPTRKGTTYWHVDMPSRSSLRQRAKLLWAIRVAFTHGHGSVASIDDPDLQSALRDAKHVRTHLRGIDTTSGSIRLNGDVTYPAIKTAVEIMNRFASPSP